jgi:hypothetical protein
MKTYPTWKQIRDAMSNRLWRSWCIGGRRTKLGIVQIEEYGHSFAFTAWSYRTRRSRELVIVVGRYTTEGRVRVVSLGGLLAIRHVQNLINSRAAKTAASRS